MTGSGGLAKIEVADVDGIRFITFSRPAQLNALTVADLQAIVQAVDDAPGLVRALVFTGSGHRSFSAGMHLEVFADLTPETALPLIGHVRNLLDAVRLCPLPTAAMINGYCLGVAFELALACDLRVVADDAQLGLPEVKVGIPSIADAALLQRHVGLTLAKEIILTGDLYPVAVLAAARMINRVVAPDQLRPVTVELLGRITRHTTTVLASQKRLFETWINTSHRVGVDASLQEFAGVFAHPETRAAVERARSS